MNKIYQITALTILVAACQFQQPDYLKMISPVELHQILQNEDIFLVDVHIPQQKHIKGTDLFVAFNEVNKHQDQFPKDKNTPVYLYCAGGPMGNAAAKTLHELGYTHLYNLDGGANAWKESGFEFE
jgi:rhodanese-related sulfurtransferase